MTFFAPPLRRFYALPLAGGAATSLTWTVRSEALDRFARSPFPTRIVGFPSYLWFGLKRMEELGHLPAPAARLQDPAGRGLEAALRRSRWTSQSSTPWSGGCWGSGRRHIHELFGAVEHPIFYNTCPRHHFHVPIYARVLIRDPADAGAPAHGAGGAGEPHLPPHPGHPGAPAWSPTTWACLTPGEDCGCGITSPYLTILGRVGMPDIQTCAAGAAELLGRGGGVL